MTVNSNNHGTSERAFICSFNFTNLVVLASLINFIMSVISSVSSGTFNARCLIPSNSLHMLETLEGTVSHFIIINASK